MFAVVRDLSCNEKAAFSNALLHVAKEDEYGKCVKNWTACYVNIELVWILKLLLFGWHIVGSIDLFV